MVSFWGTECWGGRNFYIEKEAKIGRELVGVLVLATACIHASSIPSSFPFRWGPSCISLSPFYIRSSESMINRYQPILAIHVTLVVDLCSLIGMTSHCLRIWIRGGE